MSASSLDIEKRGDSRSLKSAEKEDAVEVTVLVQDVDARDSKLDRFARSVTTWITQRGLEGHGCVCWSCLRAWV